MELKDRIRSAARERNRDNFSSATEEEINVKAWIAEQAGDGGMKQANLAAFHHSAAAAALAASKERGWGSASIGEGARFTMLPDIIKRSRASGFTPFVNEHLVFDGIRGKSSTDVEDSGPHFYVRRELVVSADCDTSDVSSGGQVEFLYKNGKAVYETPRASLKRLRATTTTGASGAGSLPSGQIYEGTPEFIKKFAGPMLDPMVSRQVVTPGNINDITFLKVPVESVASFRGENPSAGVASSDPTTAELTIGAAKVGVDIDFSSEVEMKSYVDSVSELLETQGGHAAVKEMSESLTSGSGTGNNPKGIVTAADAISNVKTLEVTRGAVSSLGVSLKTLQELRKQIKPQARSNLIFMANGETIDRMVEASLDNDQAPLVAELFRNGDDARGYIGRLFNVDVYVNDELPVPTATLADDTSIGIMYDREGLIVRTTGLNVSVNRYGKQGRDLVSLYLRGYVNSDFIHTTAAAEYDVALLRSVTS